VTTKRRSATRVVGAVLGVAVAVGLAVWAFAVLDVVVATAVAIGLVTTLGIAVAASGWDQHSTYEERELARARRRQEKWDRNKDARERDRLKWEAHHARQANRPDGGA
jgi:cadmium resistance protein CadD (predicted permease)